MTAGIVNEILRKLTLPCATIPNRKFDTANAPTVSGGLSFSFQHLLATFVVVVLGFMLLLVRIISMSCLEIESGIDIRCFQLQTI